MDDEEAVDEYTETRECAVAARATANDSAKKDEPARTAIHFRVRQCAILVPMICILASASFTLFFLSDRSDDNRFREQYNRDAASLLHAASVDWIQACHAMSSLSVALTAQIIIQRNNNANTTNTTVTAGTPNNASWSPFVTLPSFPEQAASVRMLAGAVFVQVLPIVPPDRRAEWEAYVAATTTNTIQGEPYLESVGLATLNDVKANSPGRRRRAHRILSSDSNNSNVFQSPSNSTAESALLNASSSSSDSSSIRTRIFTLDASHVASANSEGSGYCGTFVCLFASIYVIV